MKPIDAIVRRLTIFYYIFLIATITSLIMSFWIGVSATTPHKFDHQHIATEIVFNITLLLMLANSVWLLVLFVKMLIIVYLSIKDKDLFNIKLTKIIPRFVVLYITMMVLTFVSVCVIGDFMPSMSVYELAVEILASISTVIMLLMFCEVLKIGNILKVEQDLTI